MAKQALLGLNPFNDKATYYEKNIRTHYLYFTLLIALLQQLRCMERIGIQRGHGGLCRPGYD